MKKTLLFLLLFSLSHQSQAQIAVGSDAPEIRLPDSLGKWTKLSEVDADIIVVEFWASWCRNCIPIMQELKKYKEAFAGERFEVYSISLDRDYHRWVKEARRLDVPFILVNDAYGLKSPRCRDYDVERIPSKFVIKDGKIIASAPSLGEIEDILKKEFNRD